MTCGRHRAIAIAAVLGVALLVGLGAAPAMAKSFSDVKSSCWAHTAIAYVTNKGPANHKLLDDFGSVFKPETIITREQLASALVVAAAATHESFKAVSISDVPQGYAYYRDIEIALKHGFMSLDKTGAFLPHEPVTSAKAEAAVVRWLHEKYPSANWSLLNTLTPNRWHPNPGWTTGAPDYLPYIVASRQLGLRFEHPSGADGQETTPEEPVDRAEVAYMIYRGYLAASSWQLSGLSGYRDITFPTLSDRQKQIVSFSLKLIGYPYVWAGEYPTRNSPYGYQASGGFDCSGLVFYIMKMHFKYPISVNERGAHNMAALAKPRITMKQLSRPISSSSGPTDPGRAWRPSTTRRCIWATAGSSSPRGPPTA